jgi:triacylglycerol esterase/lipase EstA (alpha/beta hydrolase family)
VGCGDEEQEEVSAVRPGVVPVVLVHGYDGSPDAMETIGWRLEREGWTVLYVELPDRGRAPIGNSGRAVAAVVRASRARRIDLVGFSLGGLAVRAFLRSEGGAARARRVVFLGTPNHGTALAAGGAGSGCDRGCAQMAPESGFLHALNSGDETPGGARYASSTRASTRPSSLRARLVWRVPRTSRWARPRSRTWTLWPIRGRSVSRCARWRGADA